MQDRLVVLLKQLKLGKSMKNQGKYEN